MSGRNIPLLLGFTITAGFALLAVFGPTLAPHDPLERAATTFVWGRGTVRPPFRPFEVQGYPLGTDEVGRDLLSRLLWGIRPTAVLCATVVAVRVAVGLPLGLLGGWYGGAVERLIDRLSSLCLALPVLVFAVATVLMLGFERGLYPFVVALSTTAWVNVAGYAKQRTRQVRSAAYIESARALGIGTWRIVWFHVGPQIWAALPLLLCFELTAVILVLAELGYLGIYIGGGYIYFSPEDEARLTSGSSELGQLLSGFWDALYRAPWVPLFAGGTVALAIVGGTLLGEGLRRHLDIMRPRRRWL